VAEPAPQPAAGLRGLLRRLAAALYDGFLLGAVLMAATALALAFSGGRPLTVAASGAVAAMGHRVLLLLLVYLYFGRSWTRGGQTLGMKAWRLRVVTTTGALGWPRAALRLACALPLWLTAVAGTLLGLSHRAPLWVTPLGWLPLAVSLAPLTWGQPALHDRLSGTRVVRI
jgi:uncharacterized RDD family membrane protein YckC